MRQKPWLSSLELVMDLVDVPHAASKSASLTSTQPLEPLTLPPVDWFLLRLFSGLHVHTLQCCIMLLRHSGRTRSHVRQLVLGFRLVKEFARVHQPVAVEEQDLASQTSSRKVGHRSFLFNLFAHQLFKMEPAVKYFFIVPGNQHVLVCARGGSVY